MADEQEKEIELSDEDFGGDEFRSKVAKLKDAIAVCRREKEEYLEGWKRAKADYINAEREFRMREERTGEFIKGSILKEFLDILDQLEQALEHKPSEQTPWVTGIERIIDNFRSTMNRYGIKVIGEVHESFDPRIHEAVGVEHTDKQDEDDTVAVVVQRGYSLGDTVLRPAKVKVKKSES